MPQTNPAERSVAFGEACNSQFMSLLRQATATQNGLDGVTSSTSQSDTQVQSTGETNPAGGTSESSAQQTSTSTPRRTSPLNFRRLADMLAEQRQLWQRIGPHLDRWEAMLRTEQEHRTRNSQESREESRGDVASPSVSSPEERESMDTSDSTTGVGWSQGVCFTLCLFI